MIARVFKRFSQVNKDFENAGVERKKKLFGNLSRTIQRLEIHKEREKLKLLYSGKVWLNHAELHSRPRSFAPEVLQQLGRVDELKTRLNINPLDEITKSVIWNKFLKELTHRSTAIEGNSLSQDKINDLLDQFSAEIATGQEISFASYMKDENFVRVKGKDFPLDDVKEAINHAQAMEYMKKHILAKSTLNEDHIIKINKLVRPPDTYINVQAVELPPTRYRKVPIQVKGSPSVHPYPHELPAIMPELLRIYNEKSKVLYPIISAAQFHADFLFVHPFQDGNGRTSRLQIILLHAGYPGPLILISERAEYFRNLQAEKQHNNTELFLFLIRKTEEAMLGLKRSLEDLN